MKRFLSLLLCLTLCVASFSLVSVSAANPAKLVISSVSDVLPGSSISITVSVENGTEVGGVSANITYDPTVLQYTGYTSTAFLHSAQGYSNYVRFAAVGNANYPAAITPVVTLNFNVIGSAGDSTVISTTGNIDTSNLSDLSSGRITVVEDGLVTVKRKEIVSVPSTTVTAFAYEYTPVSVTTLLPGTLTATLDDTSAAPVSVSWNTASFNGGLLGTQTLEGTLTPPSNATNTANVKAQATVNLVNRSVYSVNNPSIDLSASNIGTVAHIIASLPTTVDLEVQAAPGSSATMLYPAVPVTWKANTITNFVAYSAGSYDVYGTINLPAGLAFAGTPFDAIAYVTVVSGGGSSGSSSSGSTPTTTVSPVTVAKKAFKDIDNHVWAQKAIGTLYKAGIVSGTGDGIYEPDRAITRAEFTKLIVKTFGFKATDAFVKFSDVTENNWFYNDVKIAVANGIINGFDETTFAPNQYITREQAVAIIYRALQKANVKLINKEVAKDFSDPCSDYANEAISKCQQAGIIKGRGDNVFAAFDNITRAEAAVLINNVYSLLK